MHFGKNLGTTVQSKIYNKSYRKSNISMSLGIDKQWKSLKYLSIIKKTPHIQQLNPIAPGVQLKVIHT